MAYDFQVVVDAAQPHEQADWWAETLGWEVEPSDEAFIRRMIEAGYATEADTTTHHGVLVWTSGKAIRHPDPGRALRMLFQQVPEGKTVKNRLHLDVRTGSDSVEDVLARLAGRGATELYRGQEGPHEWVTMADPEGNEFCVT
ncbi:MAG TPA: VOC family protein [Streptosporangiaceae bacterium]|nr:VOC family protein [Streptosporangiaceae bacterium]